jgi:hypothetical protein
MLYYCRVAVAVRRWVPDSPGNLTDSSRLMRDTLLSDMNNWQLETPELIRFGGVKDNFDSTNETCPRSSCWCLPFSAQNSQSLPGDRLIILDACQRQGTECPEI